MRDEAIEEIQLYDLSLHLHREERYEGTLIIDLKLKSESDIFLDFQGEQVLSIKINDALVQFEFKQHKIFLPKQDLKFNDFNKVEIKFINTYVTNSAGLHRF
jgi:hypothetical protein